MSKFKHGDDEPTPTDTAHRRALDLWYAESSSRISHMICSDAEIAAHQRRRTRLAFFAESMPGNDWSAGRAEQVGDMLDRQPIPADLLAKESETIRAIIEVRDELAARFSETKWNTLFMRVMRSGKTLWELEEGRWIPRRPMNMPARKPTDARGMEERQRMAVESARRINV